MPRRLKSLATSVPPTPPTVAEKAMATFVGGPRKKRNAGSNRAAHIAEVEDRAARDNWAGMTPGRLVALYWICHDRVYGTTPAELNKAAVWARAMKAAGAMVKNQFDGDVQQAVKFMRWAWNDEQGLEDWRRRKGKGGRRITWQNQFLHDYLITNWRTAAMRERAGF